MEQNSLKSQLVSPPSPNEMQKKIRWTLICESQHNFVPEPITWQGKMGLSFSLTSWSSLRTTICCKQCFLLFENSLWEKPFYNFHQMISTTPSESTVIIWSHGLLIIIKWSQSHIIWSLSGTAKKGLSWLVYFLSPACHIVQTQLFRYQEGLPVLIFLYDINHNI